MRILGWLAVLLCCSCSAYSATEVNAFLKLNPMGSFIAKTSKVSGKISQATDGSISSEKIEILSNSFKTGIELRDEHMTKKYLEADKFPSILITEARGIGGKGSGNLQIKDIKKPVQGTYTIDGSEVVIKIAFKLSDYGISKIKYMGVGVSDDVQVEGRLPLSSK